MTLSADARQYIIGNILQFDSNISIYDDLWITYFYRYYYVNENHPKPVHVKFRTRCCKCWFFLLLKRSLKWTKLNGIIYTCTLGVRVGHCNFISVVLPA